MAMGSEICELDNKIHIDTMKNIVNFNPLYLQDIDTLVFQPDNPVPAISVDCDGDILLRVDPKTKAIVGVEIEDFEGYFVAKYPAFAPIWRQMKKNIKRNRCENEELTAFLTIIQELLQELVNKQDCLTLKLPIPSSQSSML